MVYRHTCGESLVEERVKKVSQTICDIALFQSVIISLNEFSLLKPCARNNQTHFPSRLPFSPSNTGLKSLNDRMLCVLYPNLLDTQQPLSYTHTSCWGSDFIKYKIDRHRNSDLRCRTARENSA